MPYVLRSTTSPTLQQIAAIPQIVIIDQTGPAIVLGPGVKATCVVGEFLKGPFLPTEVTSPGQLQTLFGGLSVLLSQDASGVQNGGGVSWNGNGAAWLKGKSFTRLVIQRADCDVVTTSGGVTKSLLAVTVTVAAADQDGSGNTALDILIPAGTRFANAAITSATSLVATSQDYTIPKGTVLTANAVTVNITAMCIFLPEPISGSGISAATIGTVVDSALQNVSAGTSITGVAQGSAMFPPGSGTTLAGRIDSIYAAAIGKTAPTSSPSTDIRVIAAARRSTNVRALLKTNAVNSSSQSSQGRVAVVDADPAAGTSASAALAALNAALALSAGENILSDRVIITFPHTTVYSTELSQTILTAPSGWMASILSNFPSEKNPGASPEGLLDAITGLEPAFANNPLQKQDYINLLAAGVSPLQKDPAVGWWFVNGVTSVNPTVSPTRVPIKRRMMADEIQGELADLAAPYLKQPATTERIDAFVMEIRNYLSSLVSKQNPALQRIDSYGVDPTGLNTPDLTALGIFTYGIYVRLLASMDDIVYVTSIGETVTIPVAQAA